MYKEDNHFVEAIKVRSRVSSLEHEIFLDESISEPEYYRNAISLLRNEVGERDTVHVFISNGGGMVHTASLIIDAMDTCKGRIIGYLSGQCCSAATAIAMHCDEWIVGNNLHYMVHGISYGVLGKATDIEAQQDFTKRWGEKLFRDTYTGFLTDDEMELTLKYGKEHWFDTDDVKERLQNFAEHRQQQQESSLEDLFSSQNQEAERMEQVLLNKLLEDGQISQEELDIAKRVQKATLELDESLDDEQFNQLMQEGIPPESLDDEPEDKSLCKFEVSQEALIIKRSNFLGEVYEVSKNGYKYQCADNLADYVVEQTFLSKWDLQDLKEHCDDFGIKYAKNVKNKDILIKKIIEDAEKFWEDNATS